jgi:hypothetical protein
MPATYQQAVCETAVQHQGYYYGGAWYPHVYANPALFYYDGYSRYIGSGGRVGVMPPAVYEPGARGAAAVRSTVVRGGFGGIGAAHASAGGS